MYLKRVIISNFKNIVSADLHFSPNINCICGNNGEGKTNLLDAIYYLSMTKSFISSSIDRYIITNGEAQMMLHGSYIRDSLEDNIAISLKDSGEKIVKRNSKVYPRISDHIGLIPVVIISPSDTSLIQDPGENRRKFLNIILSQTDKEYLRSIQTYNRALIQRNKLLKDDNFSTLLLDSFSQQLIKESRYIFQKRSETIARLSELTSDYYNILSGGRESVSMSYQSELCKNDMETLLRQSLERDRLFKYTTTGVQRDDIVFNLDSHPMRGYASQGQQKTFLISMKMAQYSLMRDLYQYPPILLLDDVFDKLDMNRVEFLIKAVAQEDFGQIFITDSNKVRIMGIVRSITSESKFYSVEKGYFTEVTV